ncbi:hypothetical protein ACI3KS_01665 [Microbacterium sp. ZW T5_45]|uniref:hypothetical protein n=1 Tax=Microbacterium sp. ZW T5_45 TaxID=3378080 RepID=UPI003851CF71
MTGAGLYDVRFAAMQALAAQLEKSVGRQFAVSSQRAVATSDVMTAEQILATPQFPPNVKDFAAEIEVALAHAHSTGASKTNAPAGGGSDPQSTGSGASVPTMPPPPSPSAAPAQSPPPPSPQSGVPQYGASQPPAPQPTASQPTMPPPPVAPRAEAPTPADSPIDLRSLTFAAYSGSGVPGEIATIQVTPAASGAQLLTYPAGEGVYIDRVVRGDQHEPYSPDMAEVVTVTTGGVVEDDAPFRHAVRYYQVWRHSGASLVEAAASQPVIVARGSMVAPPAGISVSVDSGSVVTATWETEDGTSTVAAYRVPIEQAFAAGVGNPSFRIQAERPLLGGFSDREAAPGGRYVYQLIAEAVIAGVVHTSSPITREVHVPEAHAPVGDLTFTLHEDGADAWFDLEWTEPPGGRVAIYRTTAEPLAGWDREPVVTDALPNANLPVEARLNHPVDRAAGRGAMHHVPWPRDWSKAFFTPVVELGDSSFIGNTVTGIRVPPVRRVKIIERVDQKLVTFDFPEGANEVRLFIGQRGVPAESVIEGQAIASISRSAYEDRGSLLLGRDQLLSPCDIHLVAYASHGVETVRSAPVTESYVPVLVLDYHVAYPMGLTAAARRPRLTIQSDRELQLDPGMGFVLAYRPDRLPLTVSDATAHIALVREDDEGGSAAQRIVVPRLSTTGHSEPGWKADAGSWGSIVSGGGFIRLFVDDPRYQPFVALLDPAVGALRVGGFLGR